MLGALASPGGLAEVAFIEEPAGDSVCAVCGGAGGAGC